VELEQAVGIAAARASLPGLDSAAVWLKNRIPGGGVSVVHGDYKLDSVMYATSA
jgi:aminoglycoside phosphotransferase (APT) family kinase protein